MLGCGIKKRLLLSFIFLLMMVMHYACVQSISKPESEKNEILNTSIELDRFENELFFQVETNQNESQELIHSVAVELTYTGDNIHEYSETFQLHDNGENGDIIASNGIYTLLTTADMVVLPEIEPEIIEIDMPDIIQLHETDTVYMDINVLISGKRFRITSSLAVYSNSEIVESKIVNLDNSQIKMEVNSDYMYFQNSGNINDDCEWIENPNPDPTDFSTQINNPWLISQGISNKYPNTFQFHTQIPFRSLSVCGGTGKAIFRFILIDYDTGISDTSSNLVLTIYGCGDGVCESGFEDSNTCPEDCQ